MKTTRGFSPAISGKYFGENHIISLISKDFNRIFPELMYASMGWRPQEMSEIELVKDFDNANISYIG